MTKDPARMAAADVLRGAFDNGVWFISWTTAVESQEQPDDPDPEAGQFVSRICRSLEIDTCSASHLTACPAH